MTGHQQLDDLSIYTHIQQYPAGHVSSSSCGICTEGFEPAQNCVISSCSCLAQERLAALIEERKRVIEDEDRGAGKDHSKGFKAGAGVKADAEDMVAKEAQRLEVMKRRQERELNQMVAYELLRKQMQVSGITFDIFCGTWIYSF